MAAEMNNGEAFHVTDPSTASANGFCSSQANSSAFPAKDGLHYKESEIHVEENLHPSFDEPKVAETLKESDETHNTIIDTAAPFASVMAAVSRFRGDVSKTEETQNTEKQKIAVQVELKKIEEETLKYQKKYEETEASKVQILKEVDDQKRLAEDLKLQLEKTEIQEEQAKLDCQLALLRLKEVEDGIDISESAAVKAQLEVAKERYATAAAELASVNQELQSIGSDYALLLQERDLAIKRAAEIDSSSIESDKSVDHAALELMKTKESVESACVAKRGAEERKAAAALSLDIEKMVLDKTVEHAKEELERLDQETELTNDSKSKSDKDSGASATSTVGLEEVESEMEKANCRASCLRTELHSLQSELEAEEASLTALAEKEGSASATISALEEDLRRMDHELQLILLNRKEAHKEKIEMKLHPAAEETERAKLVADSARKELQKAKKDAEEAAATATAMEVRVSTAYGEIVAASKAIESLESSKDESTEDGDDSSNGGVTMTLEEFNRLREKADRVEEQNNAAAQHPRISSRELEEAKRSLNEKKRALEAALDEALMAEEEAILMEQQTRRCREEKGVATKIEGYPDIPDLSAFDFENEQEISLVDGGGGDEVECLDSDSDSDSDPSSPRQLDADGGVADHRRRKRVLLTRMVMFLSRKKPPHHPPK